MSLYPTPSLKNKALHCFKKKPKSFQALGPQYFVLGFFQILITRYLFGWQQKDETSKDVTIKTPRFESQL